VKRREELEDGEVLLLLNVAKQSDPWEIIPRFMDVPRVLCEVALASSTSTILGYVRKSNHGTLRELRSF
jgi:hypothetical protein